MTNPFAAFQKDTIRIISKENGNVSRNCKVSFSMDRLNLYEVDLNIAEGDIVERDLPNNRTERFEVLDVNYHAGISPIPPFFILKLTKEFAKKSQKPSNTFVNLHGTNFRFYQHSTDNSINNLNINPDTVFDDLRKLLKETSEDRELVKLVNEMEEAKGQKSFLEKYTAFIQAAANHITIISPYIPALTTLILHGN